MRFAPVTAGILNITDQIIEIDITSSFITLEVNISNLVNLTEIQKRETGSC